MAQTRIGLIAVSKRIEVKIFKTKLFKRTPKSIFEKRLQAREINHISV